MSILMDILQDEYQRLKQLEAKIQEDLKNFPKGAISKRQRAGRMYAYLVYRQGKKVKTQYIGKIDSPKIEALKKQIESRKQIERKLKGIQKDLKEIKQALYGK